MTHEYDTPSKLIEYYGDANLSHEKNERLISRLVYSGRVRLEKSPGQPLTVEELKAWVYETRVAAGISAVHGNPRRGCTSRATPAAAYSREIVTRPPLLTKIIGPPDVSLATPGNVKFHGEGQCGKLGHVF